MLSTANDWVALVGYIILIAIGGIIISSLLGWYEERKGSDSDTPHDGE